MEMVKYIQGIFISWDINMYDRKNNIPAKVQTSTLNEELGQIHVKFLQYHNIIYVSLFSRIKQELLLRII